ncbi:hypothetical protein [Streptomyces canus]|uniref:hypothetical protein n=1 Tax=Streptomyces canus TaxID=58343 RepID=UPI0022510935|nr:hypothetical protein [Streptomyces canus]MCX4856655.1 hypothetical protein [Streptomyces canus]
MKLFPLALVVAALAVGLAACGGNSTTTTPATSSSIPTPDTASPSSPGHVPLTAWSADVAILNAGQDSYNADNGFDIQQAYEDTSNGRGPEYGLNPNASGPDYAVYQIPTTATPTAVTVPTSDNGGSAIVTLGG